MSEPTRRDLVLARLRGEETELTPATLGMEGNVADRHSRASHGPCRRPADSYGARDEGQRPGPW